MTVIENSEYSSCDFCGENNDLVDITGRGGKTITLCNECRKSVHNLLSD